MENEELFSKTPVWKAIASMAVPSIITILVMIIYNMADMFFVGQLGDTVQVAAVSVVGPVFSLAAAFAMMIGGGGSALIARAMGAKNSEKGKTYGSICFWSLILIGVLIGILLLAFSNPLLKFLGSTSEMWSYSKSYLQILALGTPFMLLSNSMAMLSRSEGAIKESILGNMFGSIINIILDPIFILGLHLGVTGAAIATVLSNILVSLYYIVYIKRKGVVLNLNPLYALREPLALFSIIALGLPNAISSIFSGFASTFSNQLLSTYGTDALAAMAAAGKASMMISMIQMAICIGCQPLLAYNYGAMNGPRLKEILKKLSILTCVVGVGTSILAFFGRNAIISMFIKDPAVITMGGTMSIFLIVGVPLIGMYYLSTNFLQSIGKALPATIISLLRQGLILIPALYVLEHFLGFYGISGAYLVADVVSITVAIVLLFFQYHKVEKHITSTSNPTSL